MAIEDQAQLAFDAMVKLKAIHDVFASQVKTHQNSPVPGGDLTIEDGELMVHALDQRIQTVRRPVVINGHFKMNEYAFVMQFEGKEFCLMHLYLDRQQILWTDTSQKLGFTHSQDNELAKKIVSTLIEKLLVSPVFAPQVKKATSFFE